LRSPLGAKTGSQVNHPYYRLALRRLGMRSIVAWASPAKSATGALLFGPRIFRSFPSSRVARSAYPSIRQRCSLPTQDLRYGPSSRVREARIEGYAAESSRYSGNRMVSRVVIVRLQVREKSGWQHCRAAYSGHWQGPDCRALESLLGTTKCSALSEARSTPESYP
jgi:hypothetical protein